MASMIILTIVASFLGLLLIGAVTFTLVGLRRRRAARGTAQGSGGDGAGSSH
jgi:hypothetical protein